MQPGYNPYALDPWGRPIPLGQSLYRRSLLVIGLVCLNLGAAVWAIFADLHQRSLLTKIIDDPYSVTLAQAHQADHNVTNSTVTGSVTYLAAGVAWIVWFHLARRNAEDFDPNAHHRSIGWAIWGWVTPVVRWWFPFAIARDTLRAADRRNEPAGTSYQEYPLLRVWWGLFLLNDFVLIFLYLDRTHGAAQLRSHIGFEIVYHVVTILAAVAAILVVRRMTASNEAKRQWLQEQYADWVRASTGTAGGGPATAWGS